MNLVLLSSGETPQASTSAFQHHDVPASQFDQGHQSYQSHQTVTTHQSHQRATYVTEETIDGVKYYFCPMCGISSAVKSNVLRHVRTVHGPNQNVTCKSCGATYKNAGSLREHQRKKICGQIIASSKLSNMN